MIKKKVLIITHTNDNISIDTVIKYIEDAGGEAIRFDVDRYPLEIQLTTSLSSDGCSIQMHVDDRTYELQDVDAVWYRRSHDIGKGLSEVLDKEFLSSTIGEVRRTFFGMLEGLPCFHIERYSTYRRLDSKEEQLKIAVKNGLKIPPTCISNSPAQVNKFIEECSGTVVGKMQSSFAIYREGIEHVVFTNEITKELLADMETLQYCPMVFQQKLEKKLELRVTIVGHELFAFSIDSQKLQNAKVDWRKEGVKLIKDWQPYTLPSQIQMQLLALMDDYKLNYGAIDLILTPDDEYYFLEVNAAGEYFWLDKLCDHAISKHIAAVLLGNASRRAYAVEHICHTS
jgi:glutathione synthase/RimK-type ligase-like ATP-grasp enzyme